jgi:hypothetical protein
MIEATPEAAIGKCQRLSASEEEIIMIWDFKLLLVDDQKGCIFDNFVLGSSWYQCETKAASTCKWAYPMTPGPLGISLCQHTCTIRQNSPNQADLKDEAAVE